jgi:hypothetical protein
LYDAQWAWSLINSLFVSAATMINVSMFTVGVFLWMVNRQFHLSRKKHSYDKEPLRPLKPLKKAGNKVLKPIKKARKRIIDKVKKRRGVKVVDDVSEREEPVEFEKLPKKKANYKVFSSFLEDVEDDEGKISIILLSSLAIPCLTTDASYISTCFLIKINN